MTKYSLKEMKKNDYGRILLIASIAGKEVSTHYTDTHYTHTLHGHTLHAHTYTYTRKHTHTRGVWCVYMCVCHPLHRRCTHTAHPRVVCVCVCVVCVVCTPTHTCIQSYNLCVHGLRHSNHSIPCSACAHCHTYLRQEKCVCVCVCVCVGGGGGGGGG